MAHGAWWIGTGFAAVLDALGWHSRMCEEAALQAADCQKDLDMAAAAVHLERVAAGIEPEAVIGSTSSSVSNRKSY